LIDSELEVVFYHKILQGLRYEALTVADRQWIYSEMSEVPGPQLGYEDLIPHHWAMVPVSQSDAGATAIHKDDISDSGHQAFGPAACQILEVVLGRGSNQVMTLSRWSKELGI